MKMLNKIKVAIVYDRVNKFGGAERVLLALHEMFPDAPLYTSVYKKEKAKWAEVFPKIYTSYLQNIPILRNYHEIIGWLMPLAFESFDFKDYDLVISVTSEAAKGIITGTKTYHVCYCLTPTRYLWSGYNEYFSSRILKFVTKPIVNYLRWWDKVAGQRPDKIIAISTEVQKRIEKYYGRKSEIIFPPVNKFQELKSYKQVIKNYYLYVGRLVKYKKVGLLVDTFNELGLPLVIVGSGSEESKLKLKAKKNIKFLGNIKDEELIGVYSKSKAFLMPQDEDFGITAVEAQSFGVPVIAFKSGGALDTVINNKTGIFFNEQTVTSLKEAIAKFDTMRFNDGYLRNNAKRFDKVIFKKRLNSLIKNNNI
jgi:glycosyltransferase involved in cell wall biosynthesis